MEVLYNNKEELKDLINRAEAFDASIEVGEYRDEDNYYGDYVLRVDDRPFVCFSGSDIAALTEECLCDNVYLGNEYDIMYNMVNHEIPNVIQDAAKENGIECAFSFGRPGDVAREMRSLLQRMDDIEVYPVVSVKDLTVLEEERCCSADLYLEVNNSILHGDAFEGDVELDVDNMSVSSVEERTTVDSIQRHLEFINTYATCNVNEVFERETPQISLGCIKKNGFGEYKLDVDINGHVLLATVIPDETDVSYHGAKDDYVLGMLAAYKGQLNYDIGEQVKEYEKSEHNHSRNEMTK